MIKKKLKIIRKDKQYNIEQCPLYKIKGRQQLSNLLGQPYDELEQLSRNKNFLVWLKKTKKKKPRLIQQPCGLLNLVHTRIASLIARIKKPDYLHSGTKGRSYVSNAISHLNNWGAIALDIKSYYESISKKSVYYFFFNRLNMASDLAGLLSELCTYDDHIPTGSRLSMDLAFLSSDRMFNKLYSFSKSKDVTMTVYVDDIVFSGKMVNKLFMRTAINIIRKCGYKIQSSKIKSFSKNSPKLITGVVIKDLQPFIKNEHHKEIYKIRTEIKQSKKLDDRIGKLKGKLNAAGQIEPIFKQYAKSKLREVIEKV